MPEKAYILFRGPVSFDRFDVMELRDNETVGRSRSFVNEALAAAIDDLEQLNHMEETNEATDPMDGEAVHA